MGIQDGIVINALESALHLLNNEIQSIESKLLREEYSDVIAKLEEALKVFIKY